MDPPHREPRSRIHTFDIDDLLNPIVPRSRLHYLPRPISHFLGHRPQVNDSSSSKPSSNHPSVLYVWCFSFLGAFIGISIIENVYRNLPPLGGHDVPVALASFGAAAILEYNTIASPLAQPRNLLVGHMLSATIGVGITKLFQYLPPHRFEELRWLAGALSVGAASSVMAITKTVHPPAGATALLAATSSDITDLGWWLLALVALGCSLMLVSALLVNNLYKRFPIYWWTPVDLNKLPQKSKSDIVAASEVEKGSRSRAEDRNIRSPFNKLRQEEVNNNSGDDTYTSSESDLTVTHSRQDDHCDHSGNVVAATTSPGARYDPKQHEIRIQPDRIVVPDWMDLSDWDREILEIFLNRVAERGNRREEKAKQERRR